MRHPLAVLSMLLVASAASSCAHPQSNTPVESAHSRFSDVITRDEITEQKYANAYELVLARRPNWLRDRGQESMVDEPVVQIHLNGAKLGSGVAALRQVTLDLIQSVRFYDGVAATGRWGLGYGKGAIELSTSPQ